jgi:hypothetical protein
MRSVISNYKIDTLPCLLLHSRWLLLLLQNKRMHLPPSDDDDFLGLLKLQMKPFDLSTKHSKLVFVKAFSAACCGQQLKRGGREEAVIYLLTLLVCCDCDFCVWGSIPYTQTKSKCRVIR